jgi:hypothetical protein
MVGLLGRTGEADRRASLAEPILIKCMEFSGRAHEAQEPPNEAAVDPRVPPTAVSNTVDKSDVREYG